MMSTKPPRRDDLARDAVYDLDRDWPWAVLFATYPYPTDLVAAMSYGRPGLRWLALLQAGRVLLNFLVRRTLNRMSK
jgi:hypothetical protein